MRKAKRREPKSWVEKLDAANGLPKTMVIPAPREVDALMRRVPSGKVTTIEHLRGALAKRHGTMMACPMTTGIFAWIAAHAAEEERANGRADATPWWRTLKTGGVLNAKYPGGLAEQKRRLVAEGHRVARKGRETVVVEFERALAAV
jgi:alkylated DNA nucleotide flippase Atl1